MKSRSLLMSFALIVAVGCGSGQQSVTFQVIDLKEGTGEPVKANDHVRVHYTGWLTSGTKFASSHEEGIPLEFVVGSGSVIKGWEQGIIGIKTGGKRKLIIPAEMAYGSKSKGPIPPNSPLIFEIELVEIVR